MRNTKTKSEPKIPRISKPRRRPLLDYNEDSDDVEGESDGVEDTGSEKSTKSIGENMKNEKDKKKVNNTTENLNPTAINITEKEKEDILRLHAEGVSLRQIAKKLGRGRSLITGIINDPDGYLLKLRKPGGQRIVSTKDTQRILDMAATTKLTVKKIREKLELEIAECTVREIIARSGVRKKRKEVARNDGGNAQKDTQKLPISANPRGLSRRQGPLKKVNYAVDNEEDSDSSDENSEDVEDQNEVVDTGAVEDDLGDVMDDFEEAEREKEKEDDKSSSPILMNVKSNLRNTKFRPIKFQHRKNMPLDVVMDSDELEECTKSSLTMAEKITKKKEILIRTRSTKPRMNTRDDVEDSDAVENKKNDRKTDGALQNEHEMNHLTRDTRLRSGPSQPGTRSHSDENIPTKDAEDSDTTVKGSETNAVPSNISKSKQIDIRSFHKVVPKVIADTASKPKSKSGSPEIPQENAAVALTRDYLLLENSDHQCQKSLKSTQCFMNCICNMLYVCKDIRSLFLHYRKQCPNQNLLTDIFRGDTDSARQWRSTLAAQYHTDHQDVADVFVDLMKAMLEEVSTLPLQFDYISQSECQGCPLRENNRETRVASDLVIRVGSKFAAAFQDHYGTLVTESTCDCGGRRINKRTCTTQANYHFMMITANNRKSINFDSSDIIPMFGFQWKVIAFAEYFGNGKKGHYISWIKGEENEWICIDDDKMAGTKEKMTFARHRVRMLVFEKLLPTSAIPRDIKRRQGLLKRVNCAVDDEEDLDIFGEDFRDVRDQNKVVDTGTVEDDLGDITNNFEEAEKEKEDKNSSPILMNKIPTRKKYDSDVVMDSDNFEEATKGEKTLKDMNASGSEAGSPTNPSTVGSAVNTICSICGHKARGYYYGAYCCVGCRDANAIIQHYTATCAFTANTVPRPFELELSNDTIKNRMTAWQAFAPHVDKEIRSSIMFIREVPHLNEFSQTDKATLLKKNILSMYVLQIIRALSGNGLMLRDGRVIALEVLRLLFGDAIDVILQISTCIQDMRYLDSDLAILSVIVFLQPLPLSYSTKYNFKGGKQQIQLKTYYRSILKEVMSRRDKRDETDKHLYEVLRMLVRISDMADRCFINFLRENQQFINLPELFLEMFEVSKNIEEETGESTSRPSSSSAEPPQDQVMADTETALSLSSTIPMTTND